MSIQPDTNPADNYRTTTTSCTCPSRADQRPWEPCLHMVRLIVTVYADRDRPARQADWSSWGRRSRRGSARKDQVRAERRELRREREAA